MKETRKKQRTVRRVPAGAKKRAKEESMRIVGLELGGGKSGRTAIVLLEYFPRQRKIFLREQIAHVGASSNQFGDEVLIEHLRRLKPLFIAVNAPLTLPPCVQCPIRDCAGFRDCRSKPVRWMHEEATRARIPIPKHPTPYTQRPLDVYLRTRVQPRFQQDLFLEESLGAGRAPLAMRMQYIRARFPKQKFLETQPRLALFGIAEWFGLTARELRKYREPEVGMEYRHGILDRVQHDLTRKKVPHLFLYEAELSLLAEELPSFQALLSGLMVVYQREGLLEKPDADFDAAWGWVAMPRRSIG